MRKIIAALCGLALLISLAQSQTINMQTPAPEDVPQPVAGDIGLAGARCPDIARYLNVRSAYDPEPAPDGTRVAFRTQTTGQPQVWVARVSGDGELRAPAQITFGESATFVDWSPTEDLIAYGTDRGGNEREGFYLISPDGTREREIVAPSESFRVWGGFSPSGRKIAFAATEPGGNDFSIYTVELNARDTTPRRVYQGTGGIYVASWRPDGNALILTKTRGEDANDVLLLNLETGQAETLFAPQEASAYSSFTWTPDGRGFYMATNEGRDFMGLAFYDVRERRMRFIETPNRDVEIVSLSRDGQFLAWTENANGFSELRLRDLRNNGTGGIANLPRGVVASLKWSERAPRLAIQLTSPQVAGDIWMLDASRMEAIGGRLNREQWSGRGMITRVTESSTAGLDPQNFRAPEAVSFPSHDRETIHGLLYLPASQNATSTGQTSARPPVILAVHGGPTAQARPDFDAVFQYLLARGYAILDLNFRGSTGYGKRFARLDNGRLRPNAVRDMAAAVDWMERDRRVDASRVAVMGGSYGGFMTLAALTTFPERFRAGVNFVGVSNWVTALEGASPQLKASDRLEYGNIDDPSDREFFRELSPLTHVARIRAPLMVLHGANDPRDPVAEADQIVRAVRERGGTVEYLRFPDEGHGIRKLSNRIIAYRRVARFLERTLGRGTVNCGNGS
jgi:dipeptidyl aminopeptidase/acylaminoacyl peptidase